jgi:hypothetical protein
MLAEPEDAEGKHIRDVYAHFGVAAYHAQCFEKSLAVFLLLHGKASGATLTLQQFDADEERLWKQTMGPLIKEFRKLHKVGEGPEGAEDILENARKRRNFLMHNFFWEKESDFLSEGGRTRMINELSVFSNDMEKADSLVTAIYTGLAQELGMTDDMLAGQMAKLQAKADSIGS